MAKLIDCKKCGHEVSKAAKKCPNCDSKMPGQRISAFTWIVAIALGFFTFFILSPGRFPTVSNLIPDKFTIVPNFISDKLAIVPNFISDKLATSPTPNPTSKLPSSNSTSKPPSSIPTSKPETNWNYWVSEDEFTHEDVHHAHFKTNDGRLDEVQPWVVCRTKGKELDIFFEVGELISSGDFRPEGVKVEYRFDLDPIETANFSASTGFSASSGRNYLFVPTNKYSEFMAGFTNGNKLQLRIYNYQGILHNVEIPLSGTSTAIPKVLQACL